MRNLIVIAGFAIVAILLYIVWTDLNSKLVAVESTTGSYLQQADVPVIDIGGDGGDGDGGGDGGGEQDLSQLLDRIAALESAQARTDAALTELIDRVARLEARDVDPRGKIIHREVVYFETDDDRLSPEAQASIDRLLAQITGKAFVSLIGHADTRGDNRYNYLLSLRRAGAVKRYIEDSLAASGESDKLLVAIVGTGEESPRNLTGDEISEPANRIVEILVFE